MAETVDCFIPPEFGQAAVLADELVPLPSNACDAFVRAYVPDGGMVWDPFCRTDMVARVAARQGKRALLSDFNPLVTFAVRASLSPVSARQLDRAFGVLSAAPAFQTTLEAHINGLYATSCPVCGKPAVARSYVWSLEQARPVEKEFHCLSCNMVRHDPASDDDLALASRIDDRGRVYWALLERLGAAEGSLHPLGEKLLDLYAPRSLHALSAIRGQLEVLALDRGAKEVLMLGLLDTMERSIKVYLDERGQRQRASPSRPIPSGRGAPERFTTFVEINCWTGFAAACSEQRARLERESNAAPYVFTGLPFRARTSGMAQVDGDNAPLAVCQGPARRAAANLAPGSVNLILTSPPVLDWADMLHLSYLWTGWLLGKDDARLFSSDYLLRPKRPGDWAWYFAAMERSFRAMGSTLAPGGKIVLFMSLTGLAYLNVLLLAAAAAGLRLENVSYQPSNSEILRRPAALGAVPGYCYLRLASSDMTQTQATMPTDSLLETARREATAAAVKAISERAEPAAYVWLHLAVLLRLSQLGILARLAALPADEFAPWERLRHIQVAAVQNHAGRLEFVPWAAHPEAVVGDEEEAAEGEAGQALARQRGWWWLAEPGETPNPLSDRAEWAIYTVLSTTSLPSTQAIAKVVYALFPALQTPEPGLLEACLQSYATPASPVHWQLRPVDALAQRTAEHAEMLSLLTRLGHRLGLKVWIGRAELRNRHYGASLNNSLSVAERYMSIEDILPDAGGHSQLVDIVWYQNRKASHVFEVEWTAMLGESVLRRGSRAAGLQRFVVMPHERADLVQAKIDSLPLLRQRLADDQWLFLRFDVVRELANAPTLTLTDLNTNAGFNRQAAPEGLQLGLW